MKLLCALQIFDNVVNLQNGKTMTVSEKPQFMLNFPLTNVFSCYCLKVPSCKHKNVYLTLAEEEENTGMPDQAIKKEEIFPTETSASEVSKQSHKGENTSTSKQWY